MKNTMQASSGGGSQGWLPLRLPHLGKKEGRTQCTENSTWTDDRDTNNTSYPNMNILIRKWKITSQTYSKKKGNSDKKGVRDNDYQKTNGGDTSSQE